MRDVDQLAGDTGVKDVMWDALELHAKKSLDYGSAKDPLTNIRASEEFAVLAWIGSVIRMNDKVTRIKSFLQKGVLANESLEDSLADIIVYAAIALRLYREKLAEDEVNYPKLSSIPTMISPGGEAHPEATGCVRIGCTPSGGFSGPWTERELISVDVRTHPDVPAPEDALPVPE